MKGNRYTQFRAYPLAFDLANDLHASVVSWTEFGRWTVGAQLVRAADSIGANIAEGFGRSRGPDRRRFLVIARGSALEVEHWLACAVQRGFVEPGRFHSRIAEIQRTLNGLIRTQVS